MRLLQSPILSLFLIFFAIQSVRAKPKQLYVKSLTTCMTDSQFSASTLDAVYYPGNTSIYFDVSARSLVSSNVSIHVNVSAYGFKLEKTIDPCDMNIAGFCPMQAGNIILQGNHDLTGEVTKWVNELPSIAYTVPDLDAKVTVNMYDTSSNERIACVKTNVENGRSVYYHAVYWILCMVIGVPLLLFLLLSPIFQTPAMWEVFENMVALFQFAQLQGMYAMMASPLPGIVFSWGRNFIWSMGIIKIGFMQDVFTWYVKSTGGDPSVLVEMGSHGNVGLAKRGLDSASLFSKRDSSSGSSSSSNSGTITLRGIRRLSYMMGIETTNFFITGFSFFIILLGFTLCIAILSRIVLELYYLIAKDRALKRQRAREYWKAIAKGVFYRAIFLGFWQMSALCMWEIYTRDSSALAFLSMYVIVDMAILLLYAFARTMQIIRKTGAISDPDALFNLYSDTQHLMRWGFMYVSYRHRFFFLSFFLLIVILIRSMFIGFGQDSPVVQGCAMFAISVVVFFFMVVARPYATKHLNSMHIGISIVNMISGVFLLIMCKAFTVNELARQVIAIVFFAINAITMLVLIVGIFIRNIVVLLRRTKNGTYYRILDESNEKSSSLKDFPKHPSSEMNVFHDPGFTGTTLRGSTDLRTTDNPFSSHDDSTNTYSNYKYNSPWQAIEEDSYAKLHGTNTNEFYRDPSAIESLGYNGGHRRRPLPEPSFY
ncbi:Trp-like ion channel Pkd2 [Schizosaccharomyces cryophilus OY26]|uniref:Trp-like ion channel Pkd2 n=1 Tax=Schizosaccharomyces cryophilus (strain OY26 / ATCC MYA-4695 / CBS 11777 / NBRC 106824 / NRRL Y48691) TaxID=653667 RepID=S9VUE7_SCHCR|nr:Trp-like ion channel Pkd2 [Schizosaccharomyces cryophilus OY26]EPY51398.1 Trp-like ion channel Pkd2 [Schizosaccharomyces cryophilus OY26]